MYRHDLIRAAKAAQKKTLDDLATATGLNPNTISDICNGKESIELPSLIKVADALNVPMSALFSNSSLYRQAA